MAFLFPDFLYNKNERGVTCVPYIILVQVIMKLKNLLNILAIFPEKALCAMERRPWKTGGPLPECFLCLWAHWNGWRCRLWMDQLSESTRQFHVSQLHVNNIKRKETENNGREKEPGSDD